MSNGVIAADGNRMLTNKFAGGINIAGNIQLGALSSNYATNAQYLINDSANIGFIGDNVSLNGAMRTLTIGGKGEYTFSGVISNGGLTVDVASGATGKLIVSGENTYTGGTVISGGILQIGTNSTSGSVTGDITNNATLLINRSGELSFANVISGSGLVSQNGSGTTTLTADNTYTGATVVSNGTLIVGNGGTSGTIVSSIITNKSQLIFDRSDDAVTIDGRLYGGGTLEKKGAGTVTFSHTSSSQGGVLISEGALRFGDASANNKGQINVNGVITNNSLLILNWGTGSTFTNTIGGTGSVLKENDKAMVFITDHTYTGDTVIESSTFTLGNGGTSGSVAGNVVLVATNAALTINRSDNLTISKVISGDGRFWQIGDGTTIFTADNTYTRITTVNNGALQLGNGGTSGMVGSGNITLTVNTNNTNVGKLIVNRSDTVTLGNYIAGAGSFEQAGTGTTVLTSTNVFTGATTVTHGTLELNTPSGSALRSTASLSVASGATLLISKSDQVNDSATVTLSGGTIKRASGVSETFGNLNLTSASFLDYGSGTAGTLQFGTYTPSSLLTVNNFFKDNKLVFSGDMSSTINNTNYFQFSGGFTTSYSGGLFTITAIPEPSAYAAALALLGLMLFSLRRTNKSAVASAPVPRLR